MFALRGPGQGLGTGQQLHLLRGLLGSSPCRFSMRVGNFLRSACGSSVDGGTPAGSGGLPCPLGPLTFSLTPDSIRASVWEVGARPPGRARRSPPDPPRAREAVQEAEAAAAQPGQGQPQRWGLGLRSRLPFFILGHMEVVTNSSHMERGAGSVSSSRWPFPCVGCLSGPHLPLPTYSSACPAWQQLPQPRNPRNVLGRLCTVQALQSRGLPGGRVWTPLGCSSQRQARMGHTGWSCC